ncbi:MAG TPA: hypothetical protein VFU13_16220 [Steroidobacteraceae bacterium]|nr:hypothetical protein [Steroidobacteraceae bacterium]
MDTEDTRDSELVARLKRLDAAAAQSGPGFGYDGLIERHASRQRRARRRHALARGTASVLVVAMVGIGAWRFDQDRGAQTVEVVRPEFTDDSRAAQPRIVRADTYFAVAALEDHIASIDDALNDARLGRGTADVARLESTRALLVDSYTRVRYAEMVNANF